MDALIRAGRTYVQVLVGLILAGWVNVADIGDALTIGKSALIASVPAALSLLQNAVEDKAGLNVPKG